MWIWYIFLNGILLYYFCLINTTKLNITQLIHYNLMLNYNDKVCDYRHRKAQCLNGQLASYYICMQNYCKKVINNYMSTQTCPIQNQDDTKLNKNFILMIWNCQIIFGFTSFLQRKLFVVVNNWCLIKGQQNNQYHINNLIFIKRDRRIIDVLSNNHISCYLYFILRLLWINFHYAMVQCFYDNQILRC